MMYFVIAGQSNFPVPGKSQRLTLAVLERVIISKTWADGGLIRGFPLGFSIYSLSIGKREIYLNWSINVQTMCKGWSQQNKLI